MKIFKIIHKGRQALKVHRKFKVFIALLIFLSIGLSNFFYCTKVSSICFFELQHFEFEKTWSKRGGESRLSDTAAWWKLKSCSGEILFAASCFSFTSFLVRFSSAALFFQPFNFFLKLLRTKRGKWNKTARRFRCAADIVYWHVDLLVLPHCWRLCAVLVEPFFLWRPYRIGKLEASNV